MALDKPRQTAMTDLAIRVENLSKRYRLGQQERYLALRDVLARSFIAPFKRFFGNSPSALRNSQLTSPSAIGVHLGVKRCVVFCEARRRRRQHQLLSGEQPSDADKRGS